MQPWYWCGETSNDDNVAALPDFGDRAAFFEPTVSRRNVSIKIRNLTKVLITCGYSHDVYIIWS